jgi:uncharacterized protein
MVTQAIVEQVFAPLVSNDGTFLNHLADNIQWTLTGYDNPIAGTYTTKMDVATKVFGPLFAKVDGAVTAELVSVLLSGEWATVEFTAKGKTKSGGVYFQQLCWVCRFEGEKIVQVREYLDSAQVVRVLGE